MSLFTVLNHALNFLAPALAMAVVVTLVARLFMGRPMSFWRPALVNFLAAVLLLVLGLWFFGRDGKMATYLGMAVACGSTQWLILRAWRV